MIFFSAITLKNFTTVAKLLSLLKATIDIRVSIFFFNLIFELEGILKLEASLVKLGILL